MAHLEQFGELEDVLVGHATPLGFRHEGRHFRSGRFRGRGAFHVLGHFAQHVLHESW